MTSQHLVKRFPVCFVIAVCARNGLAPLRLDGLALGSRQFDGLPMRRVAIRVGPRLFSCKHSCRIRQSLDGHQTLKRGEPMFIIMRAIVGLSAIGCGFDFFGERCGPFFPSKMPLLGESDGESKRLRLPRLGKYWLLRISRQRRQRRESFR